MKTENNGPPTHRWDLTPKEAIEVQRTLRDLVRLEPLAAEPTTIAGVDLSYEVGGTELWGRRRRPRFRDP